MIFPKMFDKLIKWVDTVFEENLCVDDLLLLIRHQVRSAFYFLEVVNVFTGRGAMIMIKSHHMQQLVYVFPGCIIGDNDCH